MRAREMLVFSLQLPLAGTVCRSYRERDVAKDPRARFPERCATSLPGRSPDVYISRCMKPRCFQPAQAFSLDVALQRVKHPTTTGFRICHPKTWLL